MKKLFKFVVLASIGYVLYKRYQRKSACLDLIKAVPDMMTPSKDDDLVLRPRRRKGPHSHHKSGFHQELDTSVTVDTVKITYSDTLVGKWLSRHPEAIINKAGHSGRREGQGKYAPIFNALAIGDQHLFTNVTTKNCSSIRTSMYKFQNKYGGQFQFKRLPQWECTVTRVA